MLTSEDRQKNREYARRAIQDQVRFDNKIHNGIYIYFHDHLSCDAFKVEVRNYTDVIATFEDVMMWDDSDYYGTKGLKSVVNKLHELYSNYPIVWVDCAWYTFSSMYRFNVEVPPTMKSEWPDILTFHIEKPKFYIEDSQE